MTSSGSKAATVSSANARHAALFGDRRGVLRCLAWMTCPPGHHQSGRRLRRRPQVTRPGANSQRGFGGAGGRDGGRRGGRVGFGTGGAGAVFRRVQPSKFWRWPRPLNGSPSPALDSSDLRDWLGCWAPDQEPRRLVPVGVADASMLRLALPVLPEARTKAARSAPCPSGILAAAAKCSRQYVWIVPGG